jgi:hypothetical protein
MNENKQDILKGLIDYILRDSIVFYLFNIDGFRKEMCK